MSDNDKNENEDELRELLEDLDPQALDLQDAIRVIQQITSMTVTTSLPPAHLRDYEYS